MAKPDDTAEKEPEAPWGTWEELLLASAVNRYGTNSWDSVVVEIQKRSSTSILLTPHNCEQKYHDLKRRYMANGTRNDTVSRSDDVGDAGTDNTIPWLDELRKLRVAELKRELERYDLSIVSLQLKVKRLKEEREQSSRESEKEREKSDLEKSVERDIKEEKIDEDGEPKKLSPGSVADKPVSGEESDRENQSVNESNSTDPKIENVETGPAGAEKEPEPVETGDDKPDPVGDSAKPAGEDSCNGSSDSIAKEPAREPVKIEQEGGGSESPELLESVAESKGGNEEGAKENSDVQSSASLSRKKGRDKLRPGACSSGEVPESDDRSPATKEVSVKSQPLIDFLESIRSHKLGSLFERRLESQETPTYTNLIRQHIDLQTIRTRIEEGWYLGCNRKFFRDLLLLVNNAIVFFGKNSSESAAAIDLWQLVSKEMAQRKDKSDLLVEERPSLPPVPLPFKSDPEPSAPLLLKPKMSVPMIVCRKRSSIAAKASGSASGAADKKREASGSASGAADKKREASGSASGADKKREASVSASGADKKREQTPALAEEKSVPDWKLPDKISGKAEEQITKKRTRDRFVSGSRSSRKNSKSRTNTNSNKNSEASLSQNQGKGGSPSEHSEPGSEKKNTTTTTTTGVNKRSAATFLNRMRRSSSSHNGSLLDTLKNSAISSDNNKGGTEQKRSGNGRGDVRKEQVSRRSSAGRQVKEQGSPSKRSVGRPPKGATAPPPTQPAVSGKRSREVSETEAVASKQPKKRSRK
ncbi:uncharacterized protein LOC132292743 [Cornus florida]|uniref:uncharacterized protein LOC132292743 n=1 Tax=Cornus florida TaxID=4283 RepID=UPI0028976D91|nr:uncharacterized protein LOC132292743 [Cornus florida]